MLNITEQNIQGNMNHLETGIDESAYSEESKEAPFTILHESDKYLLVFILGFAGIWSTMSSSIYFPAIPTISRDFNVSTELSNITVVVYLIFQAIGPVLIAPVSDYFGRRPLIIACLICYCSVCIAISQINTYWLMVFLRCLQAISIAPVISINSGIVSDICGRDKRGFYVSLVTGLVIVGQGFGALIGAAIMSRFGWRGIFVALAIGSGVMIPLVFIFVPETNRRIVGNLSVYPQNIIYKSPYIYFMILHRQINSNSSTILRTNDHINFFSQLRILKNPKVALILMSSGLQFALWTMALTTFSTSLEDKYHYSIIKVGLCYLSPGIATLLGSLVSGKILDYNYKIKYNAFCSKYELLNENEKPSFDIVKARLEIAALPLVISSGSYIAFGWCIQKEVSIALVIVFSFLFSFATIFFMNSVTTLLVDLYPNQSSTLTSCINLLRCLLGALFVGLQQKIIEALNLGGCFTLVSGISILFSGALFLILYIVKGKD